MSDIALIRITSFLQLWHACIYNLSSEVLFCFVCFKENKNNMTTVDSSLRLILTSLWDMIPLMLLKQASPTVTIQIKYCSSHKCKKSFKQYKQPMMAVPSAARHAVWSIHSCQHRYMNSSEVIFPSLQLYSLPCKDVYNIQSCWLLLN